MRPPKIALITLFLMVLNVETAHAQPSLESVPPVVIKTVPEAGAQAVDPGLKEIEVTFSKEMTPGSWSWGIADKESYPKMMGDPKFLTGRRTCVLPVNLEPNKVYQIWINAQNLTNFRDMQGRPALPYFLSFKTKP